MRNALGHLDVSPLAIVLVLVLAAAVVANLWLTYGVTALDVAVVLAVGVAVLLAGLAVRRAR